MLPWQTARLHSLVYLQTQTERSKYILYITVSANFYNSLTLYLLSLQFERDAAASAVVRSRDGKLEVRGAAGSMVKDLPKIKNTSDMKMLVSELCFGFHLF